MLFTGEKIILILEIHIKDYLKTGESLFFFKEALNLFKMKSSLFLALIICLIKLRINFPISNEQKFEPETFYPSEESEENKQLYKAFMWFNNHRFFEPNVLDKIKY